ncbi:MAG: tRNA (adenosine(37)-N6)-threonylcarbamoyltransferase complex transferase subunit TsaD [Ezakiella sp.]|nr:tRNA (adenosine(37)-N6)-threonylcarbamoyltransferase complex transferase subunit TsaD [Ezakiella sp.]
MYTLAIETSCDETSIAIVDDNRNVLSNIIATQIATHKEYGGVVPEIASRMHIEAINMTLDAALSEAKLTLKDIDFISVTQGPGLVGALLVGVSFAKALAVSNDIPIVAVNHMRGHIASNYITHKSLEPPYIALVLSGGHSYIMDVIDYNHLVKLGETRDDAAGEAYDKVARVLGIGYPGGAELEKLAKKGRPTIDFPRVYLEKDSYDFSFSGLKTAVINYINTASMKNEKIIKEDVACSFQDAVIDVIVEKSIRAARNRNRKIIAISGGVSNNRTIFEALKKAGEAYDIEILYPLAKFTSDNAAMIGEEGMIKFKHEGPSDIRFIADPNMGL